MQLRDPVLYHTKLCGEDHTKDHTKEDHTKLCGEDLGTTHPQDDHLLPERCGLVHRRRVHQAPLQMEGFPVQIDLQGAIPVPDSVHPPGNHVQTAHDRETEKTV